MRVEMTLKGVHTIERKKNGKVIGVYRYAWRGGPRLYAEPGTQEFIEEYNQHIANNKKPLQGTITWLVAEFKSSDAWKALKPRTKKDHNLMFRGIDEEFGTVTLKKAEATGSRRAFKAWRSHIAQSSPKTADKAWSSLSRIFTYAVDEELMSRNPCANAGKMYSGNRAVKFWSQREIDRFRAAASPQIALALLVAEETGQRQGDLLSALWGAYDGQYFTITQSKTGKVVKILCTDNLRDALDGIERSSTHILTTGHGTPWTKDGFQASWQKVKKRAGIVDRTFHDLRGTFVIRRLREGSKLEDIARVTGHSLADLRALETHYMGWDQETADNVILTMQRNKK